jgi:anti-sigma factor RsiW
MATRHICDDDLELYAMDRLDETDAAPVEEHLLVCEGCRERLAEWDEYVRAMLAAMAVKEPSPAVTPSEFGTE